MVNIAIVYIVDAFESGILALKASKKNKEIPLGGTIIMNCALTESI